GDAEGRCTVGWLPWITCRVLANPAQAMAQHCRVPPLPDGGSSRTRHGWMRQSRRTLGGLGMGAEWAAVPLSELTSTPPTYGVVQPGQDTPDGTPMLRVNNFQGHSLNLSEVMRLAPEIEAKYGRTRIQTGDVLLTIVGSVGQVAVVPDELSGWNIARAIAMIRPNKP